MKRTSLTLRDIQRLLAAQERRAATRDRGTQRGNRGYVADVVRRAILPSIGLGLGIALGEDRYGATVDRARPAIDRAIALHGPGALVSDVWPNPWEAPSSARESPTISRPLSASSWISTAPQPSRRA